MSSLIRACGFYFLPQCVVCIRGFGSCASVAFLIKGRNRGRVHVLVQRTYVGCAMQHPPRAQQQTTTKNTYTQQRKIHTIFTSQIFSFKILPKFFVAHASEISVHKKLIFDPTPPNFARMRNEVGWEI